MKPLHKEAAPLHWDSSNELPEGWCKIRLGEVCSVQGGFAFKSRDYKDTGIPLIRISNLVGGSVALVDDTQYLPDLYADEFSEYLLEQGDIVMALSGATTGKLAVCQLEDRALLNQRVGRFRWVSDKLIDKRFFAFYLQVLSHYVLLEAYGGAQPNISPSKIEQMPSCLPPLAEQKRIVAKVEQLLTRVNAARERLAKVPAILKRFHQSVLAAAFSGQLTADWRNENPNVESATMLVKRITDKLRRRQTRPRIEKKPGTAIVVDSAQLPETWEWVTVVEISDRIHYGYTASSKSEPVGPRFLRITDIQNKGVNWDTVPYCKIEEDHKPKYLLKDGDLVFARTGATVGKSYLLTDPFPESVFASYLIRIVINENVSKRFVYNFFQSSSYWSQIISGQVGIGQPNVNAQVLSAIVIPFPPLHEQYEIVRCIEALFKLADAIEKRVTTVTAQADKLTQSILAKAFWGELVPTEAELARGEGRSYEPASVLLERIKTERGALEEEKRSRKGVVSRRRRHRKSAKTIHTGHAHPHAQDAHILAPVIRGISFLKEKINE